MPISWPQERLLYYRRVSLSREKRAAAPSSPTTGSSRQVRVGIWDLNTSAGSLPNLLAEIESHQSYFSFYNVVAPFQTGLTMPGPQVAAEWLARTGDRMPKESAAENVSAIRLYHAAEPVLQELPIDWLIMIVSSMISDASDPDPDEARFNLFASFNKHTIAVSTLDLREFAAEGGRPFEVAVMGCALSMLVKAMVPEVGYLMKSTGSIFDYCEIRHDIVKCIRAPHIDQTNRAVIPEEILRPTEQVIEVLRSYAGSVTPDQMKHQQRKLALLKKKEASAPKVKSGARKAASLTERRIPFSHALKALQATLKTAPAERPTSKKKSRIPRAASKGPARRK